MRKREEGERERESERGEEERIDMGRQENVGYFLEVCRSQENQSDWRSRRNQRKTKRVNESQRRSTQVNSSQKEG